MAAKTLTKTPPTKPARRRRSSLGLLKPAGHGKGSPIVAWHIKHTPTSMPKAVKKTKIYKTVSKTKAYQTSAKVYGKSVAVRNKAMLWADNKNRQFRRILLTSLRWQMWGLSSYMIYVWLPNKVNRMMWEQVTTDFSRTHQRTYQRARSTSGYERDHWWTFFGVKRNAPDSEVRAAYRKAARLVHPDITHDNGEAMRKVNAMFEQYKRERGVK